MTGQTIILAGAAQRNLAERIVRQAPAGAVVTVKPPRRTTDQNALMWAMLSDLSRQMPEGRKHTPDVWKGLVMHAAGHEVQWMDGLAGEPFPAGFRTSRLTRKQMADLIDWVSAYGAEHGVKFHMGDYYDNR